MVIAIDIRSLNDPLRGGVGEYTSSLLEALFHLDPKNEYLLFTNSFTPTPNRLVWGFTRFPNVRVVRFSYPNKLFNFSLRFLRFPKLDNMLEKATGKKVDVFFIPNLNFVQLSKNCKSVLVVHDLSFELFPEFFSFKRRLWHKFVEPRRLAREAETIIAISENTKEDLMDLYKVPEQKIKVIYPGVGGSSTNNESRANVRIKYNLPDKFILYLGTLEPRKNLDGLIKAFEVFKQKTSPPINHRLRRDPANGGGLSTYQLIIAGQPGWLSREIYKAAEKSSVKDHIRFIGYVAPEDKPALYQSASLFVYPSIYEGFGFPPLEAGLQGTPTIVSSSSSFFETLGEGSLLVDPWNVHEIAEGMFQVLTDEKFASVLREKGREAALRFSWEKCAKEVLQELTKL
jgi:glycosyltransferase involved in cell wall biosynthesis